jgi:hypothetical protein
VQGERLPCAVSALHPSKRPRFKYMNRERKAVAASLSSAPAGHRYNLVRCAHECGWGAGGRAMIQHLVPVT